MQQQLAKIYHDILGRLRRGELLQQRLERESSLPFDQILALGKAAVEMSALAAPFARPPCEGFLVTKVGHLTSRPRPGLAGFECWETEHPVPGPRSLLAAQRLDSWSAERARPGHLLLLLSGGASSLIETPRPPLDLADLQLLNQALLASGLPIEKVNIVRKHLSLFKGGGLGQRLVRRFPKVTQLIASDVVCQPPRLDLVGSGPALADPSTRDDARILLEELRPHTTRERLERWFQALGETPKALSLQAELLADYRTLAAMARAELGSRNGHHESWNEVVLGDIEELARSWAALARRLKAQGVKTVLVATGEPTVRLRVKATGRGGRCQELAVHFARAIAGESGISLLAAGSDGQDGPTPYAGAVVDGETWSALLQAWGEEGAEKRLARHDSSGLLEALPGSLLRTGPSGLNLNDLFLLAIS